MSGDEPRLGEHWLVALEGAFRAFGKLIVHPTVVAAWTETSILVGYTVGGIAGHVLSLAVGLESRLETDPPAVEVIPYEDWYRVAALPSTVGTLHKGLIDAGEALASRGPERVNADLARVRGALLQRLREVPSDRTIPLASVPGAGVRLDDFLRTRFLELVVHADDIATSAGVTGPQLPVTAWAVAATVVAETSGVPGAGDEYVLRMCRPDRRHRT